MAVESKVQEYLGSLKTEGTRQTYKIALGQGANRSVTSALIGEHALTDLNNSKAIKSLLLFSCNKLVLKLFVAPFSFSAGGHLTWLSFRLPVARAEALEP